MKFSLYSGKQQKEHIDEAFERVLAKAGWTQTFRAEFIRIAFGYAAVAVALFVYYLEKTVSFKESRWIIGGLCVLYFSITWSAWLWKRRVELDAAYIGTKGNSQVWIATVSKSNSDEFEVTVTKETDGIQETSKFDYKLQEIVDKRAIVHEEKLTKVLNFIEGKR